MAQTEKPHWYKVVTVVVVIVFCVGLIGSIYSGNLWYVYQRTLPRSPNPGSGNVYARNVHGIVVYQTRAERDRLDRWEWWSSGMCFGAIVLGFAAQKLSGEKPDPFKPLRERYGRVPNAFR